jgi:hypothetical protein
MAVATLGASSVPEGDEREGDEALARTAASGAAREST